MNKRLDDFMTEIQSDEFNELDLDFEEANIVERTGKTYVIVTDDGPCHKDVFLTWTNEMGGYYTTVDYIDEVGEFDFFDTVDQAIDRAKDADSGTFGGWNYPMKVMEVLNFSDAYNDGEEPELVEIQTIKLN
jgi:hypothetical protein